MEALSARSGAGDLDGATVYAALTRGGLGVGECAELVARELEGEGAHVVAVPPRGILGFGIEFGAFGIRPRNVFEALLDFREHPVALQAHLLEGIGKRQRNGPAER